MWELGEREDGNEGGEPLATTTAVRTGDLLYSRLLVNGRPELEESRCRSKKRRRAVRQYLKSGGSACKATWALVSAWRWRSARSRNLHRSQYKEIAGRLLSFDSGLNSGGGGGRR
ncbi:hypothetical protein CRG98_013815 [Punica granatum]|uniref:Uncharacterized protein n=1 Tax=Punica granatum TaxID=22663 RepID=A0A2I0KCA0_PUNGR|nr:hypothetical protein CRG98_013815 [Punica granatum]